MMNTAEFLRERGIQPSLQRIKIYESLFSSQVHPSADSIHRSLQGEIPTLSRTTVYSTLELFVRKGIAQQLAITGTELRFDADVRNHGHFGCSACGAISDLPDVLPSFMPLMPQGYKVERLQLFAWGLCPSCAASA
jgi:Fur family peroxide stress response transcriptional regulator